MEPTLPHTPKKRKRYPKMKAVAFKLTDKDLAMLRHYAEDHEMTISEFMRMLIRFFKKKEYSSN